MPIKEIEILDSAAVVFGDFAATTAKGWVKIEGVDGAVSLGKGLYNEELDLGELNKGQKVIVEFDGDSPTRDSLSLITTQGGVVVYNRKEEAKLKKS